MRKLVWTAVILLPVVLLCGIWFVGRSVPSAPRPPASAPAAAPLAAAPLAEVPGTRGRPAEPPDAALLAKALAHLGDDARVESCGPYVLHTDIADARYIAACGRLATRLDDLYEERYGIRPLGEPAEAIVLFSDLAGYREFAREEGVPLGYGGYAVPARGLAVFYAAGQPFETFLTTLAHELTHFLGRRALGINLPPWLSEGLADGIGDTATEQGFRPLVGIAGSEVQAGRLREAYESNRAGDLKRLAGLERGEFDRGTVSFDYEQSALFVRFLLGDPRLAPGFKSFLRDFARGELRYTPELVPKALGVGWAELDRRFETWIRDVT